MKNKLQSKVAVALLTTMLATSAAPVFAANKNNGRIDNFYINKTAGKLIQERAQIFLDAEKYESDRFRYLSNNKENVIIPYISSGKSFFGHSDYLLEYGNGRHNTIKEVLDALNEIPTDELKQYSGNFYEINQTETNKFKLNKIADPFDENVDPENPEIPVEKLKEIEEEIKKLEKTENDMLNNLVLKFQQANDNYIKAQKEMEEAAIRYKKAKENKDSKAVWQIITKNKVNNEYDNAKKDYEKKIDKLNNSKDIYEEKLVEFTEKIDIYETNMLNTSNKIKSLTPEEKSQLANAAQFYQIQQRLYLARAKKLNGLLNNRKLSEIIIATEGSNHLLLDEVQANKENEKLDKIIIKTCNEELDKLYGKNGINIKFLREADKYKIDAIKAQYYAYQKEGIDVISLDFNYTIAKALFDLEFVPFEAKLTTPTAETIKWFENIRKKLPLIKKWVPDFSNETKDKFEINGLERIKDKAPLDTEIYIEIPNEIKSDNVLYFLFTWTPNDRDNVKKARDSSYFMTTLTEKSGVNEIMINYSVQSLIDLTWITNMKNNNHEDDGILDYGTKINASEDNASEYNASEDEERNTGTLSNIF